MVDSARRRRPPSADQVRGLLKQRHVRSVLDCAPAVVVPARPPSRTTEGQRAEVDADEFLGQHTDE